MPKNVYKPDYKTLYPDVDISNAVMSALRKSDRKMEYMERDIKVERTFKSCAQNASIILPAREDSYERLLETDQEFDSGETSPEQQFFDNDIHSKLKHCLGKLDEKERLLVKYLFFNNLTEREAANKIGVSQVAVHKRKQRI